MLIIKRPRYVYGNELESHPPSPAASVSAHSGSALFRSLSVFGRRSFCVNKSIYRTKADGICTMATPPHLCLIHDSVDNRRSVRILKSSSSRLVGRNSGDARAGYNREMGKILIEDKDKDQDQLRIQESMLETDVCFDHLMNITTNSTQSRTICKLANASTIISMHE